MTKKLALDKYLSKNGEKKLNCAQAIISGFKNKFDFVNDETINSFIMFGGGMAPENVCGAYYSVIYLLKNNSDLSKKFEIEFFEKFKTTKCKDLKSKKISCIDAISFCAEFLEKI